MANRYVHLAKSVGLLLECGMPQQHRDAAAELLAAEQCSADLDAARKKIANLEAELNEFKVYYAVTGSQW